MPYRKVVLANAGVHHIFTRSIAGFRIFNSDKDYERMRQVMIFYSLKKPPCKFSLFVSSLKNDLGILDFKNKLVRILAYCLMPTHIHIIAEQIADNGISHYVNLILKSYSKYFNVKYKRKGPLWEGRFRNVLVETDDQLLHLTRYVHLNPVSSSLVDTPQDWRFSSYWEYTNENAAGGAQKICEYSRYLSMNTAVYKKFVDDRIDYQRELEHIKHLTFE